MKKYKKFLSVDMGYGGESKITIFFAVSERNSFGETSAKKNDVCIGNSKKCDGEEENSSGAKDKKA